MVRAFQVESSWHIGGAGAGAQGWSAAGAVATAGKGGGSAAPKGAAPWGAKGAATPPGIERDTLGVLQGGGWSAGGRVSGSKPLSRCRRPEGRGQGPTPALAFWTGGSGHPLCSYSQRGAVNPGRPPASVPTPTGVVGAERVSAGPG